MADLTLIYGETALPNTANKTAESAGNWTDDADVLTYSRSTDFAHTGTYSHKFAASAAGSASQGYGYLPSANNAALTVGVTYVMTFWVYSLAGASIQLKTGGVTSSAITTTQDAWAIKQFKLTSATEATDLQVWASSGADTFYIDDIVITKYLQFTPRYVRGFDIPDEVEFFPGLQDEFLDGSLEDQMLSYRRRITFRTGPVLSAVQQKQLLDWHLDTSRQLDYETEYQIAVALGDATGFSNEWLRGIVYGRDWTVVCRETTTRTTWPV